MDLAEHCEGGYYSQDASKFSPVAVLVFWVSRDEVAAVDFLGFYNVSFIPGGDDE